MAVQIQLQVDGKDEFNRTFLRADAVFDDLTPVWEDVQQEFYAIEKEQFAFEGRAGNGGQWQELSEKYAARKLKKYGNVKILHASGRMERSLTGETSDSIVDIDKKSIAIGTSLFYAKFHHRGGKRLPKREVISFSLAQKNRLQKRIQAKLVTMLRQK